MDGIEIIPSMRSLAERYLQNADDLLLKMRQKFDDDLQQMHHEFCNELQELCEGMKTTPVPSAAQQKADVGIRYEMSLSKVQPQKCVPSLPWGAPPDGNTTGDEILATMVFVARENLQSIVDNLAPDAIQLIAKLIEARDNLQEPLDGHQIASAYDLVHSATKSFDSGSDNEIKQAALIIRESLVLHTTRDKTNVTSDGIQNAMIKIFERKLGTEFMSQLALAFSTVIRLGKDYEEFKKAAPKIFGRALSEDDRKIIHTLYKARSDHSPHYKSRAKQDGKKRGRTKQLERLMQFCRRQR